jgi:hypothetical protein
VKNETWANRITKQDNETEAEMSDANAKPLTIYIGQLKSGKAFPDEKEWTRLDAYEVHSSTTVTLTFTSPIAFCQFSEEHAAIWRKWRFLDEPNTKGEDGTPTTIVLLETDAAEIMDLPETQSGAMNVRKGVANVNKGVSNVNKAVLETTRAIKSAFIAATSRYPKRKLYLHIA